jgi:hypothetical protein
MKDSLKFAKLAEISQSPLPHPIQRLQYEKMVREKNKKTKK